MTEDPPVQRVQAIAAGIAGPSRTPVSPGTATRLGQGGYWLDSVELLELVLACEAEFGAFVAVDTLPLPKAVLTVGDLVDLIRSGTGRS